MKTSPAARVIIALILALAVSLAALSGTATALAAQPYGWAVSSLPGALNLYQISALGPRDIYVAGYQTAPTIEGRVYHFDGNAWTIALGGLPQHMFAVAALDSTHVWAGGDGGLIKFFNGTSWSDRSVPTGSAINSLFALDSTHIWAVDGGGNIFFNNGTSWSTVAPLPGTALNSVFALDANHAWAVGINGSILAWNGSTWLDQSIGGTRHFWGVSGLDGNCVWAVGDGGMVRYFNGTSWTDASLAVADGFRGVSALDVNHVFVTTEAARVYFWNGVTWNMMQTAATAALWGINALDTDHVYACGSAGNFVHGYSMLEAESTTYYFAEGTCRPTFDPYICVQNPDVAADAQVTITYMLGNGTNVPQTLVVPRSSRATVSVKGRLGSADDSAHDFSAKVECTNGIPIIAERPMYFSYRSNLGVIITGGSDVIGALQPRPTFYFAEGSCRPNFDPYICIQNPGAVDSSVTILYMLGDGTTKDSTITVPAHARRTIAVKDRLGSGNDIAHDFSARVQTNDGTSIVAERPMYFSYNSFQGVQITGGHDVVGAATPARKFYFAEGSCRPNFDAYICVQNPGPGTSQVRITYMKGDGTTTEQTLGVPTHTRQTVVVKAVLGTGDDAAHDFSAKVEVLSGSPIIAERPMYFNYRSSLGVAITGGHDVVGAMYPAGAFYFAEGTCRPNFDPYLCIQNPGPADVSVHITYMTGDGGLVDRDINVAHNSRYTVVVKDVLGSGDDAAHDFSAKVYSTSLNYDDIIVERPMYFNYRSTMGVYLTGGHDVVGYSP
ncbi:MAG: WD40/YVTN/BNR-like repeat-containing protein [Candidatus Geothermincolia bacterium]